MTYRADDDTPALIEQYAVKRDLAGAMAPIKISKGVAPGSRVYYETWSPDRKLLSFVVIPADTDRATVQFVYFGDGGPKPVAELEGSAVQWSTSGRAFLVHGSRGWSIYDYSGEGQFREAFSRPNDVGFYGWWTSDEELVFSILNEETGLRSIERGFRGAAEWETRRMISEFDLWSFELRPVAGELVYTVRDEDGQSGPMYAFNWNSGAPPRVIDGAGFVQWSSDGSQYLLTQRTDDGRVQAFWGTGSVYDLAFTRIAPGLRLNWATLTSDGNEVLISEVIDDGRQDVRLVNPAKSTEYPADHVTRMGEQDSIYKATFPSDLVITTAREEVGDGATLRARFLTSRKEYDLDTAAPDEEFRRVTISPGAKFVAFQKGKEPDYQTAYVDLRYRENWGYRPVRIGGDDGRINWFHFDDAGTGLYYIYERSNGARECYYVDLSEQVARDAVKLSRDGRVEACWSQP